MNSVYLFLRLAILAFYPDKTKISFDNNTITFRPPSLSQGVLRWVYNESRNDILCIKEHIKNIIHLLSNDNFKHADSIIWCVCKSLNKLKLCYINSTEIKNVLDILEKKLIVFNNTQGKYNNNNNNIIPNSIYVTKNIQILDKWSISDIRFINYNIKCILELQKKKKVLVIKIH